MGSHSFDPSFEQLSEVLPIFPLPGALLLPRAHLPLNIFEPRYLNMTLDALGGDRMIGMIQPRNAGEGDALSRVGCAGRITAFQETDGGRLLINLTGVCRFEVTQELEVLRGYRRVHPDWRRYRDDLYEDKHCETAKVTLVASATKYFAAHGIEAEIEKLEDLSGEQLTNFLAMNLPFEPRDKQAMLEAMSVKDRAMTLITLAEMSLATDGSEVRH